MRQFGLIILFLLPLLVAFEPKASGEDTPVPAAQAAPPDATGPVVAVPPAPPSRATAPQSQQADRESGGIAAQKPSHPPAEPYPLLRVPEIAWLSLGRGMELGTATITESMANRREAVFVFLRLSPERNRFSLHMASHAGKALSLADWSLRDDLRAGINASMYLPDNSTSTGYMRDGGRVNNARMGSRLGAFFVAGGRKPGLPQADIVERDKPGWRELIENYDVAVQNYRLVSSAGKILWPVGGPEHSIAAIAKDDQGRIVFILSQEPLTSVHFAMYLRSFPLGLGVVMYVEGGAQAGIFVRVEGAEGHRLLPGATAIPTSQGMIYVWKGRQSLLNLRGNPHGALPNIIGVR